ncbi:hypothetical protein [Bacillus paramycoides]|uniref:hypothetical protein n=1 Tax=Bacillus paramycoides TaxID=2026194 RepID=UPI000BF43F48|nr:hypothetical protein [Bacillus paramycoides]
MMNSWDELSYEVKLGAPYLFVEEYLMAGTLFISPFDKDKHILEYEVAPLHIFEHLSIMGALLFCIKLTLGLKDIYIKW